MIFRVIQIIKLKDVVTAVQSDKNTFMFYIKNVWPSSMACGVFVWVFVFFDKK